MDIFDEIQPESSGDIFDQISPDSAQDDSQVKAGGNTPGLLELILPKIGAAYPIMKAAGRLGEAGQFALDAAVTGKKILPEVMRGLKGEEITGEQLNKDLFGLNEETMAQDIENAVIDKVGPRAAKIIGDLPSMIGFAPTKYKTPNGEVTFLSPTITPGTITEMLVDPINIIGSIAGKVGKIPSLFRRGAQAAEVVADAGKVADVAQAAEVAADVGKAADVAQVTETAIPLSESGLVRAGKDFANTLNTKAEIPLLPPHLPQPRAPIPPAFETIPPKELAKYYFDDPNMQRPMLEMPNVIVGDPARSAIPLELRLKAMQAQDVAPSSRIPVRGTYKFDEAGNVAGYSPPVEKATQDMGVLELVNTYLGEKGSLGGGKKTAQQIAAKDELFRRAKARAAKTGEDAQELFMRAMRNPAILDQSVDDMVAAASTSPKAPAGIPSTSAGIPSTPPGASLQEVNREAWQAAQSKANALKDAAGAAGKKFNKADFTEAVTNAYQGERAATGLSTEVPVDLSERKLKNTFKNITNQANEIERTSGIEAGGYVNKLINAEFERGHFLQELEKIADDKQIRKNLRKLGVSDEEVTQLMHYIESTPQGPRFTPSALTRINKKTGQQIVDMPAYTGNVPSPQVLQELFKLRQSDDAMHVLAKSKKVDIGYHPRYVHRSPKIPLLSGASSDEAIYNPAIFRKRSYENVPLEKNYWKIRERYKRQLARNAAFDQVLPQGRDVSLQLRMLGNEDAAEKIDRITANAMGLGNVKELKRLQAKDIIRKSEKQLDQLRKDLGLDADEMDKILAMTNDQMYHALIGTNVKNLVAQTFQPELTGIPEVGLLNIELKRVPKFWTKADKAALESVHTRLRGAHYNPGELEDVSKARKAGGIAGQVLKFPGQIGLKAQDYVDKVGRETVFLAARRQFLRSKNPTKVYADMLDFEKQAIRDALKSGNLEKAAREYALLRSQRVMHRFSSVDKPMWMQSSKAGQLFPFTTFARGEGNKLVEDVKAWRRGNKAAGKMLAKRIAYPLLISAGLAAVGQGEMGAYMNPQLSVGGLARIGLPPHIQAAGKLTSDPKQAVKDMSKMMALPKVLQMFGKGKSSKRRSSGRLRRRAN